MNDPSKTMTNQLKNLGTTPSSLPRPSGVVPPRVLEDQPIMTSSSPVPSTSFTKTHAGGVVVTDLSRTVGEQPYLTSSEPAPSSLLPDTRPIDVKISKRDEAMSYSLGGASSVPPPMSLTSSSPQHQNPTSNLTPPPSNQSQDGTTQDSSIAPTSEPHRSEDEKKSEKMDQSSSNDPNAMNELVAIHQAMRALQERVAVLGNTGNAGVVPPRQDQFDADGLPVYTP